MSDPRATDDPDSPRVHPLEIPVVWFAVHLVEFAIVVGLLWPRVPSDWPTPVLVGISILVFGALTALNYVIRRRFIPH